MDKIKISRKRMEDILLDSMDVACELDIDKALGLLKTEGFIDE